ncbi:MAG: ATP-binding protein [Acidobacteriota bacterium]
MSSAARRPLGRRAEALVLLPAAFFIVCLLSTFVLLVFQDTVHRLLIERGREAERQARQAARALAAAQRPTPTVTDLRRLVPLAAGIAVVDAGGRVVVATSPPVRQALPPSDDVPWWRALRTPAPAVEVVRGQAPMRVGAQAGALWVDLPAPLLRQRARSLRILLPVVLGADLALLVLVVLFVPRLLSPLERLVERARQVGRLTDGDAPTASAAGADDGGDPASGVRARPRGVRDDDDVALLLRTFDDALALLHASPDAGDAADARQRLADNLAQIGALSAGVAHELRNGLATLRGYLRLMERTDDPVALRDYLDDMRHESDHLERVVEDFLQFARPGSVRPETIDPAVLLRRAAADPALGDQRVTIECADQTTAIHGDPQLLERALRNLLHNAAEAQRGVGVDRLLAVRVARSGSQVEITVRDRGPGIPDALRDRLFDPFATGRAGGVGLGLALTRRIVLLHDGQLTLEDHPEGGTVARMTLPADALG